MEATNSFDFNAVNKLLIENGVEVKINENPSAQTISKIEEIIKKKKDFFELSKLIYKGKQTSK